MSMKQTVKKPLTPQTANTENKLCQLKRDNLTYKGHWVMVSEGSVCITKQKMGEEPEWQIEIPKSIFNRFIKFYQTGK